MPLFWGLGITLWCPAQYIWFNFSTFIPFPFPSLFWVCVGWGLHLEVFRAYCWHSGIIPSGIWKNHIGCKWLIRLPVWKASAVSAVLCLQCLAVCLLTNLWECTPRMLRVYSWLCAQGINSGVTVVLYVMLGIELRSAVCKASTLSAVLTLLPFTCNFFFPFLSHTWQCSC